jgi:galactokinase
MSNAAAARAFSDAFGGAPEFEVWAPGRVNLIGEHVDYAGLPVLPMAIDRGVRLLARSRRDGRVVLVDEHARYGRRAFEIARSIPAYPAGDWGNYPKAALQGLVAGGHEPAGLDALVTSDLPPAAGLSSSSSLVVAVALAGLAAADHERVDRLVLAELLAGAEQYVGARGGGMDQAAILAGRRGHALRIGFDPLSVRQVPVPGAWRFVVAHSLASAEKSGGAREIYNARRAAVEAAAAAVGGDAGYPQLMAYHGVDEVLARGRRVLDEIAFRRFRHVVTEADRVARAEAALAAGDAGRFGRLMAASHASLRADFEVSTPALDALVVAAERAGALGARLTGAGLGGCIVALVPSADAPEFLARLADDFYRPRGAGSGPDRLFVVLPSAGAEVREL